MVDDIPLPSYKIVLLGDSSVGKTSLLHRFVTDSFNEHTPNTIGAAFVTKEYKSKTIPGRELKFEVWDTAGQERYRSLTPMYYRNCNVALVCFDTSNISESFDKAKYWIQQLILNANQGHNAQRMIKIIGTKLDSYDHENLRDLKLVEDFCKKENLTLYRCSAKSGEGVESIFDSIIDEVEEEYFASYYDSMKDSLSNNDGSLAPINLIRIPKSSKNCC